MKIERRVQLVHNITMNNMIVIVVIQKKLQYDTGEDGEMGSAGSQHYHEQYDSHSSNSKECINTGVITWELAKMCQ